MPHNATPAATAVVSTLQTRIDTLAASIVTAVRICDACCGRVCVLAGVVVQQQGAWRRPTSLNFNNPAFPSVERLTPTAENTFFYLDFFRQHKKWFFCSYRKWPFLTGCFRQVAKRLSARSEKEKKPRVRTKKLPFAPGLPVCAYHTNGR